MEYHFAHSYVNINTASTISSFLKKINGCLLLECLFCVVKVPKVQFNIGKKWVKIVEGELV